MSLLSSLPSSLQPQAVFACFEAITQVPRPSKREEKMIVFLQDFAACHSLPCKVDKAGNVLITKRATPGMEGRATVVLQAHMDMVCEKNADVAFNFDTDAIQMVVDGDWLRARGTTLGADDGIGMAMQLALLQSTDLAHGPLECLFTRDEETGLTGAMALEAGFMTGRYLINLDSEDEGQIFVSCAGGARTVSLFDFPTEPLPEGHLCFRLGVKGLTGGHSGEDIDKKHANANKLLVRFLCDTMERMPLRLLDIRSGGLHNAIPREGSAVVAVPEACKEQLRANLNIYASEVEEEFSATEPAMHFSLESTAAPPAAVVMETERMRRMLLALRCVPNGVFAMSQDMEGLVETSSNLASIRLHEGKVVATTSQRSSIASARENMSRTVEAAFRLGGAEVETSEGYPGWRMNPRSELLRVARESYVRLFGKEPVVRAIHAGLECGLFSEKYPGLDMISIGPTLRGVHSPDERLLIPTVDLVWRHVVDILAHL